MELDLLLPEDLKKYYLWKENISDKRTGFRLSLVVPDGMHERIKQIVKDDKRFMNKSEFLRWVINLYLEGFIK